MAKVYLKMRDDTRERFYRFKERLVREKGRKLTHDDVMEYLLECGEKGLNERGRYLLDRVREALEKVTGKEFTSDEAVEFLVSYLVEGCEKEQESRDVWEILQKKKEFIRGFYQEPMEPLSYADVIARFIYVPDRVFEKMKEKSGGNPPLIFLLTAAEQGAEIYGRFLGVVSDEQLNAEVISYLKRLEAVSEDVKNRFISETQRGFQKVVRDVLKRFRKKYR